MNAQAVTAFTPALAINRNHRKENNAFYSYSLIDLDKGSELAVIRLYYSASGARNYACLWVRAENYYASGSGYAGGGGYHRPSAAAADAFRKAGITLAEPIGGVGDEAIRDAMQALGHYLGIACPMILRANA